RVRVAVQAVNNETRPVQNAPADAAAQGPEGREEAPQRVSQAAEVGRGAGEEAGGQAAAAARGPGVAHAQHPERVGEGDHTELAGQVVLSLPVVAVGRDAQGEAGVAVLRHLAAHAEAVVPGHTAEVPRHGVVPEGGERRGGHERDVRPVRGQREERRRAQRLPGQLLADATPTEPASRRFSPSRGSGDGGGGGGGGGGGTRTSADGGAGSAGAAGVPGPDPAYAGMCHEMEMDILRTFPSLKLFQ
ncbi:MAG: hypothetical protein BJ554DRAFT_1186, partial [Olpidium bornovanus]